MDYEFIFKKGKYKGKTVGWVEDNDPSYIVWAEECAPNLLGSEENQESEDNIESTEDYFRRERYYIEPENEEPYTALKPNLNFDNEGKNL